MKAVGKAPSTIANLGALYDIGGIAVKAYQDKVILEETDKKQYELRITGKEKTRLSSLKNNIVIDTLKTLQEKCLGKHEPLKITLEKNVPVAKGLGSSASSIAAAIDAFQNKYGEHKCSDNDLIMIAGEMEGKISGSIHYDNVLPALMGNGVLIYKPTSNPPGYRVFKWPKQLVFIIGTPEKASYGTNEKTKLMRSILPQKIDMKKAVENTGYASLFFYALHRKDYSLLGKALNHGGLIEEKRAEYIPGYWSIKKSLLENSVIGVNISGAGPSIFAVVNKEEAGQTSKLMEKLMKEYIGESKIVIAEVYTRSILR